jgi:predicted NBD/HSP70 family sugar kinase
LALADLNGTVVGRWNTALRGDRSPKTVTEMVGAAVLQLLKQHAVPSRKVLEMCAGAPGITDVTAGRVLSAPNLTDWHDVPFRDLLQQETQIPTTIENDVNLGALGEGWRGSARGTANFVFLAVGTGIGAGIVVNNILHHGATWSAGEVGYMLLPGLRGDALATDDLGALESAVGGKSIERKWTELTHSSGTERPLKATEIFDQATAGDPSARTLLLRVAEQLAAAVTNLSLVLDLSLVVLGGSVGRHPSLLEAMRRRLERNEFARPQLVMSSLGTEASMHGAIWLAMRTSELSGFRRRPMENRLSSSKPLGLAGD